MVVLSKQGLSLDEGMLLWRGRILFKIYLKGKRHKYGIKIYSLTEPGGLTLRFAIYSGAGGELSGKGHADKVVMHLMKDFLNVGHSLYMDNCYNSFPLASKLLSLQTYCTGTLRSDRKYLPEDVKSAKLKKGETIERYAEGVMVGKWRDEREVTYISTEFENTMVVSNNRYGQSRDKPLPIVHYNAEMKGIDRADQMMSYYPCERKTVRWYKKVFIHFLQMLMINALKLYNFANAGHEMNLYDFRIQVIDEILPPPQMPLPRRPNRNPIHVISKIIKRDARGRIIDKRCRVCYQEGRKKRTVYMCAQCPGEPGLCAVACYDKYHS